MCREDGETRRDKDKDEDQLQQDHLDDSNIFLDEEGDDKTTMPPLTPPIPPEVGGRITLLLNTWERTVNKHLKIPLRRSLVHLSRTAALHPGVTVLAIIVVSLTLATTGFYTNFRLETDGDCARAVG